MKKLVVVGNGMAGMACLEQILTFSPRFDVTVLSDETHVNYNRVLLSSVLAGEKGADDIVINGLEWYQRHAIDLRRGELGSCRSRSSVVRSVLTCRDVARPRSDSVPPT